MLGTPIRQDTYRPDGRATDAQRWDMLSKVAWHSFWEGIPLPMEGERPSGKVPGWSAGDSWDLLDDVRAFAEDRGPEADNWWQPRQQLLCRPSLPLVL